MAGPAGGHVPGRAGAGGEADSGAGAASGFGPEQMIVVLEDILVHLREGRAVAPSSPPPVFYSPALEDMAVNTVVRIERADARERRTLWPLIALTVLVSVPWWWGLIDIIRRLIS